ncbi:MAG: DUF4230 domain-containing protein [bacterium]|nr:DUF4230 domain-containing protein [bacterium]
MLNPRKLVLLFLAIIFLVVMGNFFWRRLTGRESYSIDVSRDAVVTQIQALNRYETSSFTIEKIIDAGTVPNNALGEFLYGDRILLIAHGEVISGFDLSKLQNEDVQLRNKNITVTLPPPQILVARLDSEKTRVYDRQQGLLSRGDKDLETNARMAAEQSIKEAACESEILTLASNNARTQLTAILKAVGFETVVITIPEGKCE